MIEPINNRIVSLPHAALRKNILSARDGVRTGQTRLAGSLFFLFCQVSRMKAFIHSLDGWWSCELLVCLQQAGLCAGINCKHEKCKLLKPPGPQFLASITLKWSSKTNTYKFIRQVWPRIQNSNRGSSRLTVECSKVFNAMYLFFSFFF